MDIGRLDCRDVPSGSFISGFPKGGATEAFPLAWWSEYLSNSCDQWACPPRSPSEAEEEGKGIRTMIKRKERQIIRRVETEGEEGSDDNGNSTHTVRIVSHSCVIGIAFARPEGHTPSEIAKSRGVCGELRVE